MQGIRCFRRFVLKLLLLLDAAIGGADEVEGGRTAGLGATEVVVAVEAREERLGLADDILLAG